MFLGSILYSALGYDMVYGAQPTGEASIHCRDLEPGGLVNDSDCDQWRAGFSFIFFQGVFLWIAGITATPIHAPREPDDEPEYEAPAARDEAVNSYAAKQVTAC